MDPSPIRIVVQQAWKPEIIVEESEEELEAFNKDLPTPTSTLSVTQPRVNVIHLQVPPRTQPRSRRKKKSPPPPPPPPPLVIRNKMHRRSPFSFRRAGRAVHFVAKVIEKRKKNRVNPFSRDTFLRRSRIPHIRPSYVKDEPVEKKWILNYVPMNPTSKILYW
jgi:hypothetical protein